MSKRLSERADFKGALILVADYSSNPGINGLCGPAVRWLKSKTEIWQWIDESEEQILAAWRGAFNEA